MSALHADVTRKKHFIVWPQKRMKLAQILHQMKIFLAIIWKENILQWVGTNPI